MARTMAVSFGVIGIALVLMDCQLIGAACFGVFLFFGWAMLSLEEQYKEALKGKLDDEEP